MQHPAMGEYYAPAYQVSAVPWVTSSQLALGVSTEVTFSHVTRFIIVKNTGGATTGLAVGFTQMGLVSPFNNYLTLSGSESFSADLKLGSVFLSASAGASVPFTVVAGLTSINNDPRYFLKPTSSNGFQGVG